jgi:hypothetical protein
VGEGKIKRFHTEGESIPSIEFACNFSVNILLICYCHFHIFEGFISYLHIMILPFLVTRTYT